MDKKLVASLLLAGVTFSLGTSVSTSPRSVRSVASMQPISPVAVAAWSTKAHTEEALELLVLLRGTPGWWTAGPEGVQSIAQGEDGFSTHANYGGQDLSLSFDSLKRIATIQGIDVALGDNNVVLVDDVDSASGPRVAALKKIDPQMTPRHVDAVIRRSREVVQFLRCDVKLTDPKFDAVASRLCDVFRGPAN